jgi:hypothetical protein
MNRIKELFVKLISIKGFFFLTCLALAINDKLSGEYFFYAGIIVIGDRTLEKFISDRK